MKKKKWTLLYIALNIVVITLVGLLDPDLKDLGGIFNNVRPLWVISAVISMFFFWLIDGVILNYSVGVVHKPRSFWPCLRVSIIGHYYNAVTPFASGGQPAQIYYMGKIGVPGGSASSVLMFKFLVYQVILSLFSVAAFVWKGSLIYNQSPWVFWFSVGGFIINAGAVGLLLSLSIKKGFIRALVFKTIDFLKAIRLVKDPDKVKGKLDSHVDDFLIGIKLIKKNTKALVNMGLMTTLQLICYFSVTFFIYRSFGLQNEKWINIIFIQSLLYLALTFVPTPGSTGASETGFIFFFRLFFPSNLIFVSMVLWRIISYYLNILAGLVIILYDSLRQIVSHEVSR
ncbi:MAG: flippase-like domain-containing protein [Clostridiales bacterium]|nr:flippase-like domain-containing protein [Clostridiales bacterium]